MCKSSCCVCVSVIFGIVVITIAIAIPMVLFYFSSMTLPSRDLAKCPYCYGETICSAFKENTISADLSFRNILNSKNVYFGEYNNVDIVVKKLANSDELTDFNNYVCHKNNLRDNCDFRVIDDKHNYTQLILEYMDDQISLLKPFKVCSTGATHVLFDYFLRMKPENLEESTYLKNLWTILNINVEPLILQLLSSEEDWPLPKYHGACGRLVVVENRGASLLSKEDLPWLDRAYLALQLLQSAKNFTFKHPHFRFYLTDISPDNIAVDDSLKLTFVDLEHLVVFHEKTSPNHQHKSETIYDPAGFAYTQDDLCSHSVSDHNYYAVCTLLLSRNAPYPMMKNGLLHTPPVHIAYKYQHLFDLIEECAEAKNVTNRFEPGDKVIDILNVILS